MRSYNGKYCMYDKPFNLMTEEERDSYWVERTGEHYRELTEEEKKNILNFVGIIGDDDRVKT